MHEQIWPPMKASCLQCSVGVSGATLQIVIAQSGRWMSKRVFDSDCLLLLARFLLPIHLENLEKLFFNCCFTRFDYAFWDGFSTIETFWKLFVQICFSTCFDLLLFLVLSRRCFLSCCFYLFFYHDLWHDFCHMSDFEQSCFLVVLLVSTMCFEMVFPPSKTSFVLLLRSYYWCFYISGQPPQIVSETWTFVCCCSGTQPHVWWLLYKYKLLRSW